MANKMIYSTGVRILTCVNGCKNSIGICVSTNESLTGNKKLKQKVKEHLMKEYAVEGMYDCKFGKSYGFPDSGYKGHSPYIITID